MATAVLAAAAGDAWPRRLLRTDTAWAWLLVAGAVGILVWALSPPPLRTVVAALFGFLPVLAVPVAVRWHRPLRSHSWWLIGGGLSLVAVAALLYEVERSQGAVAGGFTFPALVLLAGVALRLAGFLSLIRSRRPVDRGTLLDLAVIGIAAALLFWYAALDVVIDRNALDLSRLPFLVLELGLLTAILRLVLGPGGRHLSFWLLLCASLLIIGADLAQVYLQGIGRYGAGSPTDAGWYLGALLWAGATLHPSMADLVESDPANRRSRLSPWVLITVSGAALVAPALFLVSAQSDQNDLIAIAAAGAAMTLLIIARLALALRSVESSVETRAALEGELRSQSLRDPVTGIGNRFSFDRQLALALERDPFGVTVLCCDLDGFKALTDSLGHFAGDTVLVDVAARIAAAVAEPDLVARLSSDEFAVLLRAADPALAKAAAKALIARLGVAFTVEGQEIQLGAYVGIALAQRGHEGSDVLRNAEIALDLAHRGGRGRFELFAPDQHAALADRFALATALRRAVEAEEFVVAYQPIVDLRSERLVALEALVRWKHPERGTVLPGEFIPLAEETGLIVPLGAWVLDTACRQMAAWTSAGLGGELRLHVNVSPVQLSAPDLVSVVQRVLRGSGLSARRLILEVTESAVVEEAAIERLNELKALGVSLAVDDFGTGYSALSYLGHLPIDGVKLDRSFVERLGASARSDTLIANVVRMAAQLHLDVVAEGIETEQQLEALKRMHCPAGQGFLFGHAQEPAVIGAALSHRWRMKLKAAA